MKMKSPSEVRARIVLKDYAATKIDHLYAPTPTSMTVRCLLLYAAWFEGEVSTSNVRVAFMLAVASEPKFAKHPVEPRVARWLWMILKAINGMRTASKDFADLVANVMKEIQFEQEKQTHRSTKTPNPKQQSYSTLTTQSKHHHIGRQLKCGNASGNTLLKAHEVMTPDRPIKYLSRQYVKVHAHGRRGFKVRFPQEYFVSIATAMEMVGCGKKTVPRRKKSGRAENSGCERSLEIQSWSWKTAVHDQRSAGDSQCSEKPVKATGKAVSVGHARPEAVCAIRVGTQRRVAVPDGARQNLGRPTRWQRSKSTLTQTGQEMRSR